MTALSILEMNRTLVAREYAMDDYLKTLPRNTEPVHYWYIYRKSKSKFPRKGERRWVFVRDFVGTKADVARFWNKHFRDGNHRLKHLVDYSRKVKLSR